MGLWCYPITRAGQFRIASAIAAKVNVDNKRRRSHGLSDH